MTWYLYDSNGYVGDLASSKGLTDLRTFTLHSSNNPKVKAFFKKGFSTSPVELQKEFKLVRSPDDSVNETIHHLVELLGKCKDVAIISDGTE